MPPATPSAPAVPPGSGTPTEAATGAPLVSVVVPVHDTLPYLAECFDSVAAQTLDPRLVEVIAVDDGSTDGSARWLDAWAADRPNATVLHAPASGGAGRPRNLGIERARGRYLFFLDSDDRLGERALERLVAMAEEHDSDVVYGRIVGTGGRPAPVDLRTTSPTVDLFHSPVYWTLAAYKLWRRTLVDAYGLRFTEGLLVNEDLPFAVHGLLHAARISVVADHDCYYLRGRADGGNATRQDLDWPAQFDFVAGVMELVARHVPAGPDRDALMRRHFHGEVLSAFGPHYLARDATDRLAMAEAARPLLDRWLTEPILDALPPGLRLRAHHLRRGDPTALTAVVAADTGPDGPREVPAEVSGGRAHALYPGFRAGPDAPPEALYDLTRRVSLRQELSDHHWDGAVLRLAGRARLTGLGPEVPLRTSLLLRRQGYTCRIPAETDTEGHWTCAVDLAAADDGRPLPEGQWTVRVAVAAGDPDGGELYREAWLPRPAGDRYDGPPEPRLVDRGPAGITAAAVFHSAAHGHVNLDIGATRFPLGRDAHGTLLRGPRGRITVEVLATLPGCSPDAELRLVLDSPGRTALPAPGRGTSDQEGRALVRCPVRGLPAGTWEVRLRVAAGGFVRELPVAGPDGGPLRVTVRPPAVRRSAALLRRGLRALRGLRTDRTAPSPA
ncbi:glycosyltransferase family 2 protein [Streptomyces sp. NPDC097619]|uniref:glycosyltransferase family 2 protein n=1 Tax=Streptomyces sp. NPDC097619 TaxID=3157228 RepID=UPI00331CEA45